MSTTELFVILTISTLILLGLAVIVMEERSEPEHKDYFKIWRK